MSDVYLTLVSDVTSDYSGNVANKFKVKPQLRLPGEGWKVSIQSAIVPKMGLFHDLQKTDIKLIALYGKAEKNGSPNKVVEASFKSSELKNWEQLHIATTEENFFNCIMYKLDETGHSKLTGGYKFSKDWTRFTWDKKGAQPELIISSASATNALYLDKTFANKMGWTTGDSNATLKLGRNMLPVYTSYEKGQSSLRSGKTLEISFGFVKLNAMTDWRFINLKQSFKEALNLHERSLSVTANVTANSETVTQSLGLLYYAPVGRERYMFTPPVEEFYEVQTDHWEEVEISLKEQDGALVNFQPDSQCLIRLHFKK